MLSHPADLYYAAPGVDIGTEGSKWWTVKS